MGLYISKSILEVHGGTISITNNTDGKGATCVVTLPLGDGPEILDNELK